MLPHVDRGILAPSVATDSPSNNTSAFVSAWTTHDIAESRAAGTSVRTPVSANNPGGDPLAYALKGTVAARFGVTSTNRQTRIKSGVTYDHDAKSSDTATVEADRDNSGGNSFAVTVSATDLDEKPSTHPAPTLADVRNSDMPGPGDRHTSRAGKRSKVNPMILAFGLRPSILFVAVTALLLSLAGAPAAAMDGSVPARPTGLSTVATHESVTLTWNAPEDDSITHYKVLRRDPEVHAAYHFVTIEDDTGTAATRYTDDTVKPGKRYIYRVKAVNPHGVSTWSRHAGASTPAAPAAVPARPTGLSTVATHESVTLTWNAPEDDSITHYKVLRRDPEVHAAYHFVTIEDDTGTAATRYTDDTVKPGKRYIYRVKAVNPHGVSTWSRHAGASTPAAPAAVPARPTGLSTVATHESVTLTWNSPDDDSITHYQVLRRDRDVHPAYQFVTIEIDTGTAATRYTDDTAESEKRYAYRIKAVNPHGVSTWSRHARADTPAAPAPEPTPLTADFVGMPAEHDGENGFRFRVAFSENIGISFRALREDAFTVSGGRVTGGRRVDGRRDLFEMTVRPDSVADVTIALPAGRECGVSGAICTKGENRRQLTNTPTATVAGPEVSHENTPATGAPIIAGTARVGEALTADISGIADADGLNNPNFEYQWISCGGPTEVCILGATNSTYTLVANDAGKTIKVLVYFTDDAGNSESLASDTVVVSATPAPEDENSPATGAPTIAGTAEVGDALTADISGIADADGLNNPNFEYQWISCGGPTEVCILGATNSTYTLVANDAGKTIKVLVYFTDDAGNSESLASDTVVVSTTPTPAPEDENSPATGAPTIAGTAEVGDALTADISGIADADGLSSPSFTYQWVSCGGPTDVCILGATDSTYTLVAADGGKSVKVVVSFTDDAGNPESLTSNIAAVASTPEPTEGLQPPGAPGVRPNAITYHVEDGRNWVTFRWTRPSGVVDGYEILRQQNTRREAFKVIARIDDPDTTSYEDHTVIESSDYYFQVRAFNSAGVGAVSQNKCGFLDSVTAEGSQGLTYPGNVRGRLTENGTAILLTWTAPTRGYHGQDVSPATGYQILRWDVTRGYANWDILVDNTGSTVTSYVDRDIAPHNTYDYKVRAWNDWGVGDRSFSAEIRTQDLDVIGAPRNFRVGTSSEGAALTWDAPEGDADTDLSYRIYRREHSGATVPLVLLASDHGATSYTDGTVVPGSEYHYQVRVDGDPLGSRHGIPTKLRFGFYAAPHDLSVAPAAPDADPAVLSVADARAREGTDETIDFRVSLSRAMSASVTVDYATADGRGMAATAGEDYTPVSGTLTFAPGETAKTVAVAILDDVIDEGEEGFALRLSNARGARIADAVGFGWIVNSDPLQKMWLSRFGRTVAGHVVDAVAGRLSGPTGGSQVTLGGQNIDLAALSSGTGDARRTLAGALGAERAANDDDPLAGPGAWEASSAGSWAGPQTDGATSRTLTGRELLRGSSFHLAAGSGEAGGPGFAAWGRVTVGGFDAKATAEAGTVRLDGEVTTGVLGADAEWERWLAGVAVSVSEGEGTFDQPGVDSGTVESTLTSVNPYMRVTLSDRVSAWGLLGYGTGDMTMTQAATEDRAEVVTRTDLSMRLGAVGARGALLEAGETGGLDLALRGDAFLVQMESEKAANTVATKADASRLRLVLEGSRTFALGEGAVLTPGLEVGLRHDGGDAETGTGIEVGGRIRYTDAGSGLTVEANARTLIAHEDSGYEEWGAGGSVRLDSGASGRGLSLSLAPVWGTPSSGVERLWSARDAAGLVRDDDFEAERRLEGEIGYGLAAFGGAFTGTPNLGFRLSDSARVLRLGWRLTPAARGDSGFEVNLDATRREAAGDDAVPENAIQLELGVRF